MTPCGEVPTDTLVTAFVEVFIMETLLEPEFVTNSLLPSGEMAQAAGEFWRFTLVTPEVAVLMIDTVPGVPPELMTYALLPSGEMLTATGVLPTLIGLLTASVPVLITDTVPDTAEFAT